MMEGKKVYSSCLRIDGIIIWSATPAGNK